MRRKRRKGDKTALVLGGGGFTGGVYEIGALRALDLLAVNTTVNEFDVYVGTSAGSFVASMTANGITPEETMRVLNKALPSPIEDPKLRHCCGRTTAPGRRRWRRCRCGWWGRCATWRATWGRSRWWTW